MEQLITYLHKKAAVLLLTLAVGALAVSCVDDDIYTLGPGGIEGAPTRLTLSVNLNDMKGMSRAAMTDENANKVNTLWVGIYNVATGKCTYNHLFSGDEVGTPGNHTPATLPAIDTKSGMSYVVAVANAENNYGITDNAELKAAAGLADTRGGELSALLALADTWEKYRSISVMLTDPSNVDFSATNNLAMSGSYHGNGDVTNDPSQWYDAEGNPETVYITANTAHPSGYIHLRRIISYVKFNIAAAENVTVEPVSWKVCQNPIISYLQEGTKNSADVSTYFNGRPGYETNHGESNLSYDFNHETPLTKATGETVSEINEMSVKDGYSFDFYQFENKQTAVGYNELEGGDYVGIKNAPAPASPYADREREWKTDKTDEVGENYKENTGVYKSLSESVTNVNTKNNATYVTFRLKVTYWVNQTDITDVGKETPVSPTTPGAVRREGYANYTVHLGYIEGDSEWEKACDFNCRRNMKYTYNIMVKSLNNIIVEAFKDGENQPGAEGDVTDVQNTGRIELDAHYAVFNIQLSYRERTNLQWMIETPYNNVSYSFYAGDYRTGGIHAGENLNGNQFYTWIRFKPTVDRTTLRVYNDRGENGDTDLIGWTLEELADPANHRGVDENGNEVAYNENSDTPLWYTVFIDEYVYHKNEKGVSTDKADGTEGGWWAYVNQEPRIVWIACNNRNISEDRESMYLNSKYMISQNSILTYYSQDVQTPSETALGIERENETFGLNLAWSQTAWNGLPAPNADNGRWNVWYYLTNGNINATESATGRGWSSVADIISTRIKGEDMTCCKQLTRGEIKTDQLNAPADTAWIFMPKAIDGNKYTDRTTYDPNSSTNQYEVITACMSRNRDENGNRKIDASEMKWYVPTTGKYARIILGRAVIPQSQRLMNFDIIPHYGFGGNTGDSDHNTRFHFASSDRRVLWAEEGTSTSDWHQGNWDYGAWEVRCVRNLGVNLGKVLNEDPVQQAYTCDTLNKGTTNVRYFFQLTYYEDGCKRAPQSTPLPVHDVQSSTNQPAYRFEVARERCNSTNTSGINTASNLSLSGDGVLSGYSISNWTAACTKNYICGRYSQETGNSDRGTWRVPNQKELVMMRREGFLPGNDNKDGYLSCTQEKNAHTSSDATNTAKRFFIFFPNRGSISEDMSGGAFHCVRCVRDVINY